MQQPSDLSSVDQIPLVVDLDGTLIKTDLLWESLAELLRRNPFKIFQILFWWMRGRAFLKQQLGRRIQISPAALPYNQQFLIWIRSQKSTGRKIILATASDLQMALPVADYIGIFDEVLASDGKTNLRSKNKLKLLVDRFGERGFDYAGNSSADLAVWRGAREAIIVNASRSIELAAADCTKIASVFPENYFPLFIAKRFLSQLFWQSGYLIAIIAGLLLAAAFPKIGIAGFAWISPALLVFVARGKNSSDIFRIGYVGGYSFWLASLYWLLLMPVAGFPILGWLALCAYLALFLAIWLWLISSRPSAVVRQSWSGRLLWSLNGAAAWVALEMIRGRFLGGMPWNFLGASQSEMLPLIQIASVTGIYGISFLIVWTSLSLFSAGQIIFQKPASRFAWQSEIVLPFAVIVAFFVFGMIQLREKPPSGSTLCVTLIQPSVPQTLIWDEAENTHRLQQLLARSERALTNQTDVLVWPESAVPELDMDTYIAITNLLQKHRAWLICNANDVIPRPNAKNRYDNDFFNAALLFNPEGHWAGIYHKQKLVIFGEYIPLMRWLPFLKWFTPITGSFAAGNEPAQFQIGDAQISPLICFEDMFPDVARKAASDDTDFLVNLTNDGWFGNSAEQWQHEGSAIFRAVENGIPLVRCANNGVTCWIDGHGRVREILKDKYGSVYSEGAMTIDLSLSSHAQTFYNRHGDWFGWSCVIWTIGISLKRLLRRKQYKILQ